MILAKRLLSTIKSHRILIFIISPLVLLLIAFGFYYRNPVYFFKNGASSVFTSYSYTDSNNNGNSVCKKVDGKSFTGFAYTLKKGVPYPYSGIFFKDNKKQFINLSDYDYIKVRLKASR